MKKETDKKRRIMKIILYVILSLITFGNVVFAYTYIVLNHKMVAQFPHVPSVFFYIFGLLAWGNIFGMVLLFKSYRAGFWVFLGANIVITSILLLRLGNDLVTAPGTLDLIRYLFSIFGGLLGPLVLFIFLRPFWKDLK
jgi:hypothetical protein